MSHLKSAELDRDKALAEARQASEAKSQFLARLSHEMRTPLNGIVGMTELMLDAELSHDQEEHAQTTLICAWQLVAIIDDLLYFNAIENGHINSLAKP